MKKRTIKPDHADQRGSITDIFYKEEFDAATIITSKKGAIRGNHYHKETIQTAYLHEGKLKSYTRMPDEKIIIEELNPGDILTTIENEEHALEALEDSVFFVFTKGPRSGKNYEEDTFRLEKSLTQ